MLVDTDIPSADFPRIHIIMNFKEGERDISAYSMDVNIPFVKIRSMDSKLNWMEIKEQVNKSIQTGILVNSEDEKKNSICSFPYHPKTYRWNTKIKSQIIGFWRVYDLLNVPLSLEKMFFENFARHSRRYDFWYVRVKKIWPDEYSFETYYVKRASFVSFESTGISFREIRVEGLY